MAETPGGQTVYELVNDTEMIRDGQWVVEPCGRRFIVSASPAVDLSALWGLVEMHQKEAKAHETVAKEFAVSGLRKWHEGCAAMHSESAVLLAALLPPRDTEKTEEASR